MLLAKHTPGKPLTAAEHRQRRDAARRRWAILAGGTAAGAAVGANTALIRATVGHVARAEASALSTAANLEQEIDTGVALEHAEADRWRAVTGEMVRARTSGVAPRRDVVATIESMRNLTAGPTRSPWTGLTTPLPTGTIRSKKGQRAGRPADKRIYDFQIRKLKLKLLPEQRHLQRLNAALAASRPTPQLNEDPQALITQMLQDFETDTPETVRIRRQIVAVTSRADAIQAQIAELEGLRDAAPRTVGRRGTTRKGGVKVSDTLAAQYVGGETNPKVEARTEAERAAVRRQHERVLENLEARTQTGIAQRKGMIRRANLAALRDAIARDAFSARIFRRIGHGGVIGAGLGFSLAGLGLLAHHVLSANKRPRKVTKIEFADDLAKATRDQSDAAAARIARTYRRWIDRLLGRTEQPMEMGDDLTHAMAPGITQAWAEGYTTPPIDPGSDRRYRIDVDFDVINPAVRRHMAAYALDRIVDITAQQRETIRNALMNQSVLQGIGPLDVARTIRQAIGLTMYQEAQVQTFRSQLQALDPRALNRNLRDKRYDPTLQRAIDSGIPLTTEQLDAMTDAYHRRSIALRAETIARTESIRATTYGALARAQEVLDQHPSLDVIKIWHATHDARTRDTHVNLDGKQVVGIRTPWITSANNTIKWPHDEDAPASETINCRCYVEWRFIPKSGQLVAVAA